MNPVTICPVVRSDARAIIEARKVDKGELLCRFEFVRKSRKFQKAGVPGHIGTGGRRSSSRRVPDRVTASCLEKRGTSVRSRHARRTFQLGFACSTPSSAADVCRPTADAQVLGRQYPNRTSTVTIFKSLLNAEDGARDPGRRRWGEQGGAGVLDESSSAIMYFT